MVNRLAESTSPYLLQHADNPVDWYEWGAEAFAEARRRDVPILLSVGYSACHWCHVMAHESFEDAATAAYMNEHFVNIKVDREERPDIDAIYMEATQAMTGHGGWPMTCFLTPDGEPFHCGTYFPPRPYQGLPSFGQLLEAVTQAWRDRRDQVLGAGQEVVAQLTPNTRTAGQTPGEDQLAEAVTLLSREFDPIHAGFGSAPKFPPSMVLEFLLRHAARTGSDDALAMVEQTCERMARGGMYDQLGGGFARYSVDTEWVVPHFEKMLYDNALLLRLYLDCWRQTESAFAARIARETADFCLRELRTPQGGFASALDADSEGVEGKFYVWTPEQLREVLGEQDGRRAAEVWSVTETGTFEHGSSTLQLRADPPDSAWYADVRRRLFEARAERVRPDRDDKVVAAWNGLMITALAEAGMLLEEPSYVDAAVAAAELLHTVHADADDRLLRTSKDGLAGTSAGVLEDYAHVAEAFLTLLTATGNAVWLRRAGALLEVVLTRFVDVGTASNADTGDEDGVANAGWDFFDTPDDAESLFRRPQDPTDNAIPSGRSGAAWALLSYAALTGSARHRQAAEAALGIAGLVAGQAPRAVSWALAAAEAFVAGPLEIAVVGAADDPGRRLLHVTAIRSPSPGAVVVAGEPDADGSRTEVGLLAHRDVVDGQAAAYVCRGFVCDRPVTSPAELAEQVDVRFATPAAR